MEDRRLVKISYMSIYHKYMKNFKKWKTYDVFGPLTKIPSKWAGKSNSAIRAGAKYVVNIPKGARHRYWSKNWHGHAVTTKGFLRLFHHGDQIVCVERNKKFLTLPASWLILPKNSGCSCSTSTIWAKGCQCGGA